MRAPNKHTHPLDTWHTIHAHTLVLPGHANDIAVAAATRLTSKRLHIKETCTTSATAFLACLLALSLYMRVCVCVCTPTSARARAHAPPPTYVEFYSTSASPTLSIHMGTTPSVHDRLDCACVQSKRCPLDYHQCYARRRACVLRAHAPDDQSFLSFCVRALSFLFVSPLVLLYCIRHYPPLD